MTNPVYFLEPEEFSTLVPASLYSLLGAEGHHARTVKRAQLNEGLDLVDGRGGRAIGRVVGLLEAGLEVEIEEIRQEESSPRLILVQALAKGDRDLQAIEMATELGAQGIIPWEADRSIVRWKKERAAKAQAKWANTVRAAAKQSRRAYLPQVEDLHKTSDLVALAQARADSALFLVLHEEASTSLSDLLQEGLPADLQEIYFLVGPEGGISPQELDALTEAGARALLLGPEVLRSSTAGAAAISILNFASGRW